MNLNSSKINKVHKTVSDEISELSASLGRMQQANTKQRIAELQKENDLQKQIEKYKGELSKLKTANGVPEIPVPKKNNAAACTSESLHPSSEKPAAPPKVRSNQQLQKKRIKTKMMVFSDEDTNKETKATQHVPQAVKDAVFVQSISLPESTPVVKGYDFNEGLNYSKLFQSFERCGHQGTHFGLAVKEINKMLTIRRQEFAKPDYAELEEDEFIRSKSNLVIFLGYTSNMVTSGTRDTIRFLVQHKLVDCLVTTAGGIEEDLIKVLAPTYVGSFHMDDRKLRDEGINRAGNLLIPNENYCLFEQWVNPILDKMIEEQKTKNILWTPSKMIARLGEEIDNEESIYYWAAVNKIPVFCPALTDGSLGDMMYFHSFRNPGLILDIVQDLRRLNTIAVRAKHTGMIILGGGVVKHHICNANLMRNGADFSVYINTGLDYDGSDSGARPEEAISWGKIRKESNPVKIYADASLVFPLLVAETFAKHYFSQKNEFGKPLYVEGPFS